LGRLFSRASRVRRRESNDLLAKHPEKVQELAAKWEAWAARANILPWVWKPAYRAGGK